MKSFLPVFFKYSFSYTRQFLFRLIFISLIFFLIIMSTSFVFSIFNHFISILSGSYLPETIISASYLNITQILESGIELDNFLISPETERIISNILDEENIPYETGLFYQGSLNFQGEFMSTLFISLERPENSISHMSVIEGESNIEQGSIIVSEYYLRNFDLALGDTVILFARNIDNVINAIALKICGISEYAITNIQTDTSMTLCYIHPSDAELLLGLDESHGSLFFINQPANVLPNDSINQWAQINSSLNFLQEVSEIQQIFMIIIKTINYILAICVFIMLVNSRMVTVLQTKNDYILFHYIGYNKATIFIAFIFESTAVLLFGICSSLFFTVGLMRFLNHIGVSIMSLHNIIISINSHSIIIVLVFCIFYMVVMAAFFHDILRNIHLARTQ